VVHLQSVADPASAHNNVAVALMEAGNYAAAREEIAIALGYNRQNTAALKNLQLLSEVDGKLVEFKPVTRPEGRWPRVHAAWRRMWGPEGKRSTKRRIPEAMSLPVNGEHGFMKKVSDSLFAASLLCETSRGRTWSSMRSLSRRLAWL